MVWQVQCMHPYATHVHPPIIVIITITMTTTTTTTISIIISGGGSGFGHYWHMHTRMNVHMFILSALINPGLRCNPTVVQGNAPAQLLNEGNHACMYVQTHAM